MLSNMVHRGPDQDGIWQNKDFSVAFGHRRLSIIDLSEAGRQPMLDPDSGVVMTYNGECYNYLEIRRELVEAGQTFHSKSDTEVILKAYVTWGIEFVHKIRGMFALAIWDPRIRQTLLIRDRMGIKPVYYAHTSDCFIFASELRAVLASTKVARELNANAVAGYIANGFVTGPETIVRGVMRLNAGTLMRVDAQGKPLEQTRYWIPANHASLDSSGTKVEQCVSELSRAVEQHMVSDVPLGVFLSGGVDSSAITALAKRSTNSPIKTFNISFTESEYDESVFARKVAGIVGADHHELVLTETMFHEQLETATGSLDQPTFDAINTYFVSRAVREEGITVALAGTGGDELFGGYPSFQTLTKARNFTKALSYLPGRFREAIGNLAIRMISRQSGEVRPQVRWGKIADMIETQGNLIALYQVSYALFTRDFQQDLLATSAPDSEWGLSSKRLDYLESIVSANEQTLNQISTLETAGFLGERLLPDTDVASMAVSLEVRVPLLDHRFVESVLQLEPGDRFGQLGRKQFLRNAVSDELDPTLFDRPKAGFELPMDRWCRNQLSEGIEDTFRDINLVRSTGLNSESVMRLWRAFQSDAPGLYWSRVWSLYILIIWCRNNQVKMV